MSKHRTFTPEFKARVVLELLSGTKSSAELGRQQHLSAQLLSPWQTIFLERAALVCMSEEQHSQEAARIAEVERRVGRMTLEAEIVPKATSSLQPPQHGNGR
jgi:transposase